WRDVVRSEGRSRVRWAVPAAEQNSRFRGGEPSGNPGPRAGCPLRGTPRGDGREQSLKTLPANCCDATHSETSLRAIPVSIILHVFSRLSRWAEIARQWRHIDVSSVCHEPRV